MTLRMVRYRRECKRLSKHILFSEIEFSINYIYTYKFTVINKNERFELIQAFPVSVRDRPKIDRKISNLTYQNTTKAD